MDETFSCDILVLTIIKVELDAARRALKLRGVRREKDQRGTNYLFGSIRSKHAKRHYRVALVCVGQAGNSSAAALTAYAVAECKPLVVLASGIAGGLRGKVKIGSVVFSEMVVGYESGAIRENKAGAPTFEPRPSVERPPHSLVQDLIHYSPNSARLGKAFRQNGGQFPQPSEDQRTIYQRDVETSISVSTGTIASGDKVIKSPAAWSQLQTIHGKIEVVEMEAKGILDACWMNRTGWLVIRGISDFGDQFKKDEFHTFAATAALTVLADFIVHGLELPARVLADSPNAVSDNQDTRNSGGPAGQTGNRTKYPRWRGHASAVLLGAAALAGVALVVGRGEQALPRSQQSESVKVLALAANYERVDSESRQVQDIGARLGISRGYNSATRDSRGVFGLGWHSILETAVDPASSIVSLHIRDGYGSSSIYQGAAVAANLQSAASLTLAQFATMDPIERAALVTRLSGAFPLQSPELFAKVWISTDSIVLWRETAGGRVRFSFGLDGRLASVGSPGSPEMNVSYDSNRTASRLSIAGTSADLLYDDGRVVRVKFSDGASFDYKYDSRSFRLSKVVSSSTGAALISYDYDTLGHLVEVSEPGFRSERIEYDRNRRTRVIRNSERVTWTFITPSEARVTVERPGFATKTVQYGPDPAGVWDLRLNCLEDGSRWALTFTDGGCHASRELRSDGSIHSLVRDEWGKVVRDDGPDAILVASYDEMQRPSSFQRRIKSTDVVETYDINYESHELAGVRSSSGWTATRVGRDFFVRGPATEVCSDIKVRDGRLSSAVPGCPTEKVRNVVAALFWRPEESSQTDSLLRFLVFGQPPRDL